MKNDYEKILLSPPCLTGREQKYIDEAFKLNWIVPLGPQVDAFEQEILKTLGTTDRFAVAMNSGTSAIHIALRLLNIKPGEEIFCSTLTFIATANPILYEKAKPVFIDCEKETWNLCPKAFLKAVEAKKKTGKVPRALIAVDLYGESCDYIQIEEICKHYGIELIEDAAEALGSTYREKNCGAFGRFGILSFNGNKIITTSGGGMLICKNENDAKKAHFLITQARDPAPYYQHSEMGFNYRMSNICAAIGLGQLETLPARVERRSEIFKLYSSKLSNLPLEFPAQSGHSKSNRWLSTLLIKDEAQKNEKTPHELMTYLQQFNIESRRVWKPLHTQPLFAGAEIFQESPGQNISEDIFARGLCLPSGAQLTATQLETVANKIISFF